MNYALLANIVTVLHTILIVGVLVGILISVRYKRFRPIEAAVLLGAVIIWSLYGGCPLTYLENFLRTLSGYPLPLIETGFIPYYFSSWLGWSITNSQLTIATYVTAVIFLLVSIKWASPYINLEIIKIRKSLGLIKHTSKK